MNVCCVECFKDEHIRRKVETVSQLGDCPFCTSQNVPVCDVAVLGRYVRETLEKHFVRHKRYLGSGLNFSFSSSIRPCCVLAVLRDNYKVFSDKLLNRHSQNLYDDVHHSLGRCNSEGYELANALVSTPLSSGSTDELFREGWTSEIELKPFDLHQRAWREFKHHVRHFSRYFDHGDQGKARGKIIQPVIDFLGERMETVLPVGMPLWRTRIMNGSTPFPPIPMFWGTPEPDVRQKLLEASMKSRELFESELGPPPTSVSANNRMSPAGISYSYLADDNNTAIAEVRPQVGDKVWLGEFEITKQLRVADLSNEARFQQRSLFAPDFSPAESHLSEFLKDFVVEMSRPIDPKVSLLEYVTTQVLCEAIRFKGFDGICFRSSLVPYADVNKGRNYVLFCGPRIASIDGDEPQRSSLPSIWEWLTLRRVELRTVKGVSYESSPASDYYRHSF